MSLNNNPVSPTRQICKRLSLKMKVKNINKQIAKVFKHNDS